MNLSIYYFLGFINNYSGGFSSQEGIFQRLSLLDDHFKISKKKVEISNKLIKICEETLLEFSLNNDLKIEYWEENRGMIIYSINLTKLIDNFCKNKEYFLGRDYFEINESIFDKSENYHWRDENSPSNQQKIMFLRGTYDSNANDNEFIFYNDYNKCLLTHRILKNFADEDDEITLKSRFKTPWVDRIIVNKNGDIWKIIDKYCL